MRFLSTLNRDDLTTCERRKKRETGKKDELEALNHEVLDETSKYRRIKVVMPRVADDYNKAMGGCDLSDRLMKLAKLYRKNRWALTSTDFHVDSIIANCVIMYNRLHPDERLTIPRAKILIAQGLVQKARNLEAETARNCKKRGIHFVNYNRILSTLSYYYYYYEHPLVKECTSVPRFTDVVLLAVEDKRGTACIICRKRHVEYHCNLCSHRYCRDHSSAPPNGILMYGNMFKM